MKRPHQDSGGQWFGWPGDLSSVAGAEQAALSRRLEQMGAVPIELTSGEVSRYYDGFSNGVLWPLLHYLLDKVNLDAESDWRVFQQVNATFAKAIAGRWRPGDQVWVHDYHLALVPGLLRRLIPRARIGFFLHVPFPAADVFRILPWREDILRGLLGADLVGFHTATYRNNFNQAVTQVLGMESGDPYLNVEGRAVRTGVYPIGIDVGSFERAAASPAVGQRVEEIRRAAGGKKIVLGIDRLDYTKGVPRRLLALDRLLSERPSLRDQLHFVQIAVPTREKVDAYSDLRRTVNELVGRVNAQHGTAIDAPIHLLYRSVDFLELVALYRAADVMLVTPLRDGMNLVAKEYVAARADGDGVLILSEFAGAACELPQALLVNPYDLVAVGARLQQAIDMEPVERQRRMSALRQVVRAHDVERWAAEFREDLAGPSEPGVATPPVPVDARSIDPEMRRLRAASVRTILLDYDGTLVPLAPRPELAAPDPELRRLLIDLASLPATAVHVVSGRDRGVLERWLGDLPVGLHAEHGFWSRGCGGQWAANGRPPEASLQALIPLFEDFTRRIPGCLVECKETALAFHYRLADPALVHQRLSELREALGPLIAGEEVEVLNGSKVLEVRPLGVNKGLVVAGLSGEGSRATPSLTFAAGDDLTDEDMFRALPRDSIAVKVGPGPTLASWQVAGPQELRRKLWSLLD